MKKQPDDDSNFLSFSFLTNLHALIWYAGFVLVLNFINHFFNYKFFIMKKNFLKVATVLVLSLFMGSIGRMDA